MMKLTQAEFDAMTRDERGYINIPDETDCTGVDFHGTDKIVFGYGCELGHRCILGDYCELGDDCILGDYCTLGEGCRLGFGCELGNHCDVRATFECGSVENGLYVNIGNIGRYHGVAYFYIDDRGNMYARVDDLFSGIQEFKKCIHGYYGGTLYEAQYMAACQYAEAVLPLMLAADDERRAENG